MPRVRYHFFTCIATCLGMATGIFTQPALAEPVRMLCVDAEGKSVAGVEIHLFQYDGKATRYVSFGPFQSDDQGKATCDKEVFTNDAGNFDRWYYARVPRQLVGAARSAKWTNRKPFNADGEIKLYPSTSVEGQIAVPEGFDCRKVKVRTRTLHISTGPGIFDEQSFTREESFPGLDNALPEIFERHPDAEGRIQFDDVPVQGQLLLVTEGAGLAEAQWRNLEKRFEQPIEMAVQREGVLSGRVLTPDGKPAGGVKIAARLAARSGAMYLSTFRAVSNLKGEYSIHNLPEKAFDLSIEEPKRRWTFRPQEDLLVRAGGLKRNLQLEPGVLVSGRVLDPEGKPVSGAAISVLTDGQTGIALGDDMTDFEGRYKFRIPSGKARLYFNSLPDGFAYPRPPLIKTLDITPGQADIEKLDFTLQRQANAAE